jgi:hypothetical protein
LKQWLKTTVGVDTCKDDALKPVGELFLLVNILGGKKRTTGCSARMILRQSL